MKILFAIASLFLAYKIITTNKGVRMAYYYYGICLCGRHTLSASQIPFASGYSWWIAILFIALLADGSITWEKIKQMPMRVPLLLLLIGYLLIGIFDSRLSLFSGIYYALDIFEYSYFGLILGYFCIDSKEDLNVCVKRMLPMIAIIGLYGVFTFLIKSNPLLGAFGSERAGYAELQEGADRGFRVVSTFANSSHYAMFLGVFALLMQYTEVFLDKKVFLLLGLIFLNIMLSLTRSGIAPAIVMNITYAVLFYNTGKILRYALLGLAAIAIIISLLPSDIVNNITLITDSFYSIIRGESGDDISGSSLDLRELQWITSYDYLLEKPWFGHGIHYYRDVIAPAHAGLGGDEGEGLYGMESYICVLFVEYGLVFTGLVLVFFFCAIRYFKNSWSINHSAAIVGISFMSGFVLFMVFSWMRDIFPYCIPVMGALLKCSRSNDEILFYGEVEKC